MEYHRIIELDLLYQNIWNKRFQKVSVKTDRIGVTTFGVP